jgi:hypothetical protein
MLEQDEHLHLSDNPTYIHPEDWPGNRFSGGLDY